MNRHPELIFWRKCPTCGYCEFVSDEHARQPTASKVAKYSVYTGSAQDEKLADKIAEQSDSPSASRKQ